MPTLVLVFNSLHDTIGTNIDIHCGVADVFIIRKYNTRKEMWSWGRNMFQELGFGHNNIVSTPQLMFDDFKVFDSGVVVTIVSLNTDSNKVLTAGSNSYYQLGFDMGYSPLTVHPYFEEVIVGDEAILGYKIKIIKVFRYGVFVVYDNNHVYFWGRETFKINPPNNEGVSQKNPVQVNFFYPNSDISVGSNIKQLCCSRHSCFVLIEDNINNTVGVYSWGGRNFVQLFDYMIARNFTTVDYFYPREIEYGELNTAIERIILISTAANTVFFVTNQFTLYAVGLNSGSFCGTIPFNDVSVSLKRILSPPVDYVITSVRIRERQEVHYIIEYFVKDFPLSLLIWIIVGSVSFCCFIFSMFVFGVFIVLVIVIFSLRKKSEVNNNQTLDVVDLEAKKINEEEEEDIKMEENQLIKLNIKSKSFTVKKDEVELISKLGDGGSNSEIFRGIWYGKEIAVKLFNTRVFGGQNDFDEFEKEVKIVSGLNHPNIIRFFGCCLSPPRVMILICENGDLLRYIMVRKKRNESVNIQTKLRFCENICSGLTYLHSHNIIHRDLKLQNVLVSKDLVGKIIDFGLSRVISTLKKMTRHVGTSFFMSPEVVLGEKYDYKADIFSFGIILFILLTAEINPYEFKMKDKNSMTSIEIMVAQDPNLRPVFDDESKYSSELVMICKKCWEHDTSNRMELFEIKKSLENVQESFSKNKIEEVH